MFRIIFTKAIVVCVLVFCVGSSFGNGKDKDAVQDTSVVQNDEGTPSNSNKDKNDKDKDKGEKKDKTIDPFDGIVRMYDDTVDTGTSTTTPPADYVPVPSPEELVKINNDFQNGTTSAQGTGKDSSGN